MTTVYLHIGMPKTGSTSLQFFIDLNREKLLERGLLYPLSGRPKGNFIEWTYSHDNLLLEVFNSIVYQPESGGWEEVIKEINTFNPEKVIISDENLGYLGYPFRKDPSLEYISQYKSYLSNFDTKVVIYLRKQDDFLISFYSQVVKTAWYYKDFKHFVAEHEVDYYKILETWAKEFGKENIIVRVFEKDQLKGGLIQDFFSTLDFTSPIDDLTYSTQLNTNPSLKTIEFMRFLNQILMEKMAIRRGKLKSSRFGSYIDFLRFLSTQNLLSQFISSLPNFLISDQLLSKQERIELMQKYEESNRKVAEDYLGRKNGQLFYQTVK
ncbi:conserved hypothetical protein [Gloeothece citriformis PCC 7424]|uniref:Sulfotransferase domain-containing protein n=1 Tax=Gloeothece citriformis (strain PCC 7424) TaxID=65393 RepID=B7KHL7_GLOC7|nr:hypothetical protein [Gloeothece citriformis]ACK70712.1 conserved hypothetical protein [Gloeothece citriformis PCC 7424]